MYVFVYQLFSTIMEFQVLYVGLPCFIQGLQNPTLKNITACLPDVSSLCQVKKKYSTKLYECCPIKTLDSWRTLGSLWTVL
jgi:hypothetical protein